MRLLFNVLLRQYLRALHLLNVESGDSLENRDIDSMLRFDLKTQYGRATPPDDAWQVLRARIAEQEQPQPAPQPYLPAPQQHAAAAWRIWVYAPRLAQAAVALLLFVLIQNVVPPRVDGPQSLGVTVLDTPAIVVTPSLDALAPQINRAYAQERAMMLATSERSSSVAAAPAADSSAAKAAAASDDAIERRMTHLPHESRLGTARLQIDNDTQTTTRPHNGVPNAE